VGLDKAQRDSEPRRGPRVGIEAGPLSKIEG
jgi:hypothetical protein